LEILKRKNAPAGIILTRQNLPVFERSATAGAQNVAKGAYILEEATGAKPEVILIATGSEVQFAIAARAELEAQGIATRVVSAPCVEWFEEQSAEYRESVLPSSVKARVSIEAGLTLGWKKYVGDQGLSIGIDHYGASADYATLYREFGITTEAVVAAAKKAR
jgi:transketolase